MGIVYTYYINPIITIGTLDMYDYYGYTVYLKS